MVLITIGLSGCFRKEEAVTPYPRGDVETQVISMSKSYADQHYFSLSTGKVVKVVAKTAWDLAMVSEDDNDNIYINTGKNMRCAVTNKTLLSEVMDTVGLKFQWDWSNGKQDSTVLYKWWENNAVYVLNLGMDSELNSLGFVKFTLEKKGGEVLLTFSQLSKNEDITFKLERDKSKVRSYFSFETSAMVDVEPARDDFDLIFRQYVYYFAPENLDYLVVGALINPYKTRACAIFDKDFEDITLADTSNYSFTTTSDVIGYDWKEFVLSDGVYKVYANKNFLLQDSKGFYYKLHFTDFYSKTGETGYPTIEYKLL